MKEFLSRLKYQWPLEAFYKAFDREDIELMGWKWSIGYFFELLWQPFDIAICNIRRIISYIPLLWRDRDWDHSYILAMLEFKMKRVEKALLNGSSVVHPHMKRDMRAIITILGKLQDSHKHYYEPVFKPHDEKWGEMSFNLDRENPTLGKDGKPIAYSCNITRPNARTKEEKAQETKEYRALIKKEQFLEQQDLDTLFKLLRKRIQAMWD